MGPTVREEGESVPTGRELPNGALACASCFAAAFASVFAAVWIVLASLPIPNPGTWTGIRPLERKLDQLDAFARRGPVDALVLGSSIADFGFSAELFSQLMSKHLGREYRAYNFAVGGSEPRTLPLLYKLARTVARPRALIVVAPPEQHVGDEIRPPSPDYTIAHAPVAAAIDHEWLLRLSRFAWSTPILRSAATIREIVVFGRVSLVAQSLGADAFPADEAGDKLSYFVPWRIDSLPALRRQNVGMIAPFDDGRPETPEKLRAMLERYFSPPDVRGIEELARLARRDGIEVHLVAHAPAPSLWNGMPRDPAFEQARLDFFHAFAAGLGAKFHDPAARVTLPVFALSDLLHLNAYGAQVFTGETFATMTGQPAPVADGINEMELPDAESLRAPTLADQFELLRRPAGEAHPLLHVRTVTSLAMTPLPSDGLSIALRLPGEPERIVPAAAIGVGDALAEVALPASARPQAVLVRLLQGTGARSRVLRNPIFDYEWIASFPRLPLASSHRPDLLQQAAFRVAGWFLGGAQSQALLQRAAAGPGEGEARARDLTPRSVQVLALARQLRANEPLYVAIRRGPESAADIALQLRASSPAEPVHELGRATAGPEQLLRFALPRGIAPGSYQVRAIDVRSGAVLARSESLRITPK